MLASTVRISNRYQPVTVSLSNLLDKLVQFAVECSIRMVTNRRWGSHNRMALSRSSFPQYDRINSSMG